MTSPPRPRSDDPDDGTLGALAAGELPEAQAAEIRARATADPALAARVEGALRVEAALRGDGLLPVPLPLLAGVIERVSREAPVLGAAPSRSAWAWAAAAAVLALFLGLAPAAFGVESVAAAAEPIRQGLGEAAALVPAAPSVEALAPVADVVPGGVPALGGAGAALVAAGLWLAVRLGRSAR